MAHRGHDFGFAGDVGQCRRGGACEASPVHREGYPYAERLTSESYRQMGRAPLRATALVCKHCHLCFTCAPPDCKARTAIGKAA